MYSNDQGNLTDNQVGKIYKTLMFLQEIPNVDVFMDKGAEVRVHYNGGHSHISFKTDEYEDIATTLKEIIEFQHNDNLKDIHVAFREDLNDLGLSSSAYMEKNNDIKKMSIVSRDTWNKYIQKMDEVLSAL